MRKINVLTAMAAAITLSSSVAFANVDMEKCKVVKDGVGLIKANKTDCAGTRHSCAGQNAAGDPESWIVVPKGQCDKINAGDFSGVSQDVKDKIEGAK